MEWQIVNKTDNLYVFKLHKIKGHELDINMGFVQAKIKETTKKGVKEKLLFVENQWLYYMRNGELKATGSDF